MEAEEYDYYVFMGRGMQLYDDPIQTEKTLKDDSDYDSQDSNREDHEQNDYPEGESDDSAESD